MCWPKAGWRLKAIRARSPTWTKCGEPTWDFRASSVAHFSKEACPRDRAFRLEAHIVPWLSRLVLNFAHLLGGEDARLFPVIGSVPARGRVSLGSGGAHCR